MERQRDRWLAVGQTFAMVMLQARTTLTSSYLWWRQPPLRMLALVGIVLGEEKERDDHIWKGEKQLCTLVIFLAVVLRKVSSSSDSDYDCCCMFMCVLPLTGSELTLFCSTNIFQWRWSKNRNWNHKSCVLLLFRNLQTPWHTFQCLIFSTPLPRSRQSCSYHQDHDILEGRGRQPKDLRRLLETLIDKDGNYLFLVDCNPVGGSKPTMLFDVIDSVLEIAETLG